MNHQISAGAIVLNERRILLARHLQPEVYDYWAPPGGGVKDGEELLSAASRETLEETGIEARIGDLAYIEELIDSQGRMIKFWYLATYVSGHIDVSSNPARDERIVEAGWYSRRGLPKGYIFPEVLHDRFWADLEEGFQAPLKLPLKRSIF